MAGRAHANLNDISALGFRLKAEKKLAPRTPGSKANSFLHDELKSHRGR